MTAPADQYPLNPAPAKPVQESTQPRFIVKIDGNVYIGESYRYVQNCHGATDEATVVLPIDGETNQSVIAFAGLTSAYPDWTLTIERSELRKNAGQSVTCEIWAGFPPNPNAFNAKNLDGLILRFRGVVDMYSVVFDENKTTFTCRSLAAPLATTQITTPFPREASTTTVAWLQQQATRFGLTLAPPLLGPASPLKYGGDPQLMIDVLGGEYISGVRGWYVWSLALQCAQADDVDLWVDRAGVLHYEAPTLIQRKQLQYIWNSNIKGLAGTHSPQFNRNISVRAHSWTKRTRTTSGVHIASDGNGGVNITPYSRQATTTPIWGTTESLTTNYGSNGTVTTGLTNVTGGGSSAGTGSLTEPGREIYTIFPKNKTKAQLVDIVQKVWRQYSMHEYAIKLRMPVTTANLPDMDVTASLILFNARMARFAGEYWPREIIEELNPKTGWWWDADCLNHPPPNAGV